MPVLAGDGCVHAREGRQAPVHGRGLAPAAAHHAATGPCLAGTPGSPPLWAARPEGRRAHQAALAGAGPCGKRVACLAHKEGNVGDVHPHFDKLPAARAAQPAHAQRVVHVRAARGVNAVGGKGRQTAALSSEMRGAQQQTASNSAGLAA